MMRWPWQPNPYDQLADDLIRKLEEVRDEVQAEAEAVLRLLAEKEKS